MTLGTTVAILLLCLGAMVGHLTDRDQQRQIDDLKRELEELRRKLNQ